MPYSRPPAWPYFPQTDFPVAPLAEVAEAMFDLSNWFKSDFWAPVDAGKRIDTKEITRRLEPFCSPEVPR